MSTVLSSADIEAASLLSEQLIRSILNNEPFASVKTFVDNGTPLWYQNEEGMTCLHAAAYGENTDLVRYLIERGAVWNAGVSRLFCSRLVVASAPLSRQLSTHCGRYSTFAQRC